MTNDITSGTGLDDGVSVLPEIQPEVKGNTDMTQAQISYDAKSFIIRGQRELLIGGEFHYFRTPNELWEDRLIKMKRSGANLITTYIPWNWHEPIEGQQRWTGDCDLVRFIELCTKHNLFIVVKPGPYICAEWDFGGHPDWLLGKNIPLRVLDDRYLAYVEKWYRKVAEMVTPYLVTKGGNIICIQVENEYDHLMEYGKEKISKADAITYFTRLGKMMEDFGIDIPKFANEAAFLRGKTDIIDTRTYYPNIPLFQFWSYMHNYFDGKITAAKAGQPNCPTMILELQVGWFAQFGRPLYTAPVHLTESVSKSVVALGASMLNYYMYVGGTTFPFWGCRGNIWEILPRGTGTATTFDFGGSPIREWGELMPGRMDWMKGFAQFTRDFKELVLESDNCEDLKVIGGGEDIEVISPDGVTPDTAIQSETENFKLITKKLGDQYLVCVRNLGEEDKVVDIGWSTNSETVFKDLPVLSRQTHFLPIQVKVPGTELRILRSTSELLFAKQGDNQTIFGLYGKPGQPGKTVLNISASEVRVLSGEAEVSGDKEVTLSYIHNGIIVIDVAGNTLVVLDQDISGKVEELENSILIADTYFIKDAEENGEKISLKAVMRNDSNNRFYHIGRKRLDRAEINGKDIEIKKDGGYSSFAYANPKQKPVSLKWQGDWKIKTDSAEIDPAYDDSDWITLDKPISLEEAKLVEHGYVWYRTTFDAPENTDTATLVYPGNDCDRQQVFVNGKRVWEGIDKDHEIDISGSVKPGKNVIAVLYEYFFHSKSHPHEGAIRKYSGILKPLIIQGNSKDGIEFSLELKHFKVRPQLKGILDEYTSPELDDSSWQTVKPSHRYVMDEKMGTLVWMRRHFSYACKDGWDTAVRLIIPGGKERALIYLNGKPLGQYEDAGPQHDFYIPSSFLKKDNVLAIILEGPNSYLTQPELDTFYEAQEIDIEIKIG